MSLECCNCHKLLPESEFSRKNNTRGYSYRCKKCQNEYSKEHYRSNKQSYLDKNNRHRQKIREFLNEYKKDKRCEICGEDRPWCLDFHHSGDDKKLFNIGNGTLFSKKMLLQEIEKCVILCANCHRDIHHNIDNASLV